MNLEIGKIDYSIHDGNFVLHDVNKTVTSGDSELEDSLEYYFHQAGALQSLFDRSLARVRAENRCKDPGTGKR